MRPTLPAFLVLVAVTVGCDDGPTDPGLEPNVAVFAAAEIATTDDAVLVSGRPHIDFGSGIRAIFLQHSTRFTYGGLHGIINDGLTDESWYLDLGRSRITDERADTVFRRAVDFGAVALEGVGAQRIEVEGPIVTEREDHVRVLERYLLYRIVFYGHRLNRDGTEVLFVEEPFYEGMMAGQPVALTVSGSPEVDGASGSFSVRPGPRVTGVWNGETLDFQRSMPELDPGRPLMLELDRPMDPDRTIIRIFYTPPNESGVAEEARRRASAAFGLLGRTDRVVIPASALREIASNLPEPVGAFIIQVSEYVVTGDVLSVTYSDGEEEVFDALRVSHSRIYARMGQSGG